jgi:hypothetical protein
MAPPDDPWKNIPRPKSESTEAYNLLALDGGGVKGISSMIILKKSESLCFCHSAQCTVANLVWIPGEQTC